MANKNTAKKTFSDATRNGSDMTITTLTGLPSIWACATSINSVKLYFDLYRSGGAQNGGQVSVVVSGNTIKVSDISRNTWYYGLSVDLTAYVKNNGGNLSYTNGATTLDIRGKHNYVYIGSQSDWTASNIYIVVEYTYEHSYVESIRTQPTCTEQGEKLYMCHCGNGYIKRLPALGHSWTNATCTTPNKCSVCGVTEGSALGHDYKHVKTDPTETSNGYTTHTCSRCGHSYVDSYICRATFKNYDGTVLKTETLEAGKTPTAPTSPSRSGYKFVGWSPAVGAITNSTVFTAVFEPNTYKVMFDANGGTCDTSEKTVTFDSAYGTLPIPHRDNHIYDGWYPDKTFTERIRASTKVVVANDHTLYAKWIPFPYITLATSPNEGGTISGAVSGYYAEGSELTVTAAPNKGYRFVEWVTKYSDGNESKWAANPFSFEVIRDETVTAVFEKILPPEITSAQMLYQGKQISATNKVPAGEYFRIVVGAKSFS